MKKQLEKTYNPKDIEPRLYEKWEKAGYFHAKPDKAKKPFTIVMPPPNITGQLHMGHALDNTMQDILTRYKRMQGYNALWQPGTDHAAIATEVKVIDHLKSQGIEKEDLGRDGFLEKCWDWRKEYGGRIINQLKKMGSSADWERERFTMDEGCSRAVEEVFVKLFEDGYIYKGSRIINWCPVCGTSISDAEVEHEEQAGFFWHINYPVVGEEGRFVEIATTRPETMFGDTAVAVNPEDERYKDIVGKMLVLPGTDRRIPVIADEYVDMEFGTGCVKITPAHDPNDFEVGRRHGLEEVIVINDDATMNDKAGKYSGMDRYECRKALVADLEAQGLLVKVVPHTHNVGTHDRCGTTVEPMVKPQWFVAMEELAKPAVEAIKNGELKFVPEHFDKTYLHWLDGIRDWCISRQLWWGHRIPAWYCDKCGEMVVSRTKDKPDVCPKCGGHLTQDEDTLDTWFSSALWPFSTLGWPDETEDLEYFYPTDVLVTGYDIIFFWVIRMVFSGYAHTGKSPFHTVLIHGLVRDELGRKMSKSLGNGIDPLEVIDKYGADALRFALITGNAPGNDMRFIWEKVENGRNFANKIWNASRFIMMNLEEVDITSTGAGNDAAGSKVDITLDNLDPADRWIMSSLNNVVREVTENMDKYELGIAVQKVYDFIWEEFCDWYIEIAKNRIYNDIKKKEALGTLVYVLKEALKLLHPFMPFVSEEIFCNLIDDEPTIMLSDWPIYSDLYSFPAEEEALSHVKDLVRGIRNLKNEMDVPPGKEADYFIVSDDAAIRDTFSSLESTYEKLIKSKSITIQADKTGIDENCVSAVIPGATIYVPLAELVDINKEKERLSKEKERLAKELARSQGMLSNEKFLSKAPQDKIDEEKAKQEKYMQMMQQVEERLGQLGI